jgi:uncharacterized protein
MFTGTLEVDLLLGAVNSLKEKRAVVRPIINEVRRRFEVSVAEVGESDLHRRAVIGVAVVSGDAGHVKEVLEACERFLAGRPEVEMLSARVRWHSTEDE